MRDVKERASAIVTLLEQEYPDALCGLQYEIPWQLLFAVRLSAQCTDERVNMVTPALFKRYPTLESFAIADVTEVEDLVKSCGYYHAKAKDMVECAKTLLEKYDGVIPDIAKYRYR